MNYKYLWMQSKGWLNKNPAYIHNAVSAHVFSTGAKWMHERMNETGDQRSAFNENIKFGRYGLLKYGVSILFFLAAATGLYTIHISLVPLAIPVFYFFEVQFLFLFPLLADNVKHPLKISIRQTWRIGIIKAICIVVPIGSLMVAGLFNIKAPLRNWHTGSLAIVIWYQYEVRDRIK